MMPAPSAPIGPSPPPITTGVPASRPVAAAASAVTCPTTAVDGTMSGNSERGTSAASISSVDHSAAAWSYALVLEASDGSVASTPVSRYATKSLASTTVRAREKTSGS